MTLIDGKETARLVRSELAPRAAAFEQKTGRKIGLAVVLVGSDPASEVYVRNKQKACAETGIASYLCALPETVEEDELEARVKEISSREEVDGVLVQLPLPAHLDAQAVLRCIPACKDVDGFSAENFGKLARGEGGLAPCTPLGVMELLRRYRVEIEGKRAAVLGRSNIVGRPMALMLLNANATVTVCHSKTRELPAVLSKADLLVAAVGKPKFVTAEMVKEGAVVIDVGVNRAEGKLCGDVDFDAVSKKASLITPVPGGVGPMTVAMLLKNTVAAAESRA